jgi:HNH endonuclease
MATFVSVSDKMLLQYTLMNRVYQSETGCWVWKGSKRNGYGLLCQKNKTVSAHRVSYEAFCEAIPNGMVVRHSCDNPSCINPDHLSLGTQADNAADRESRHRRNVCGEMIGTAKLSASDVVAIKASKESGVTLAKKYGVSPSTISLIKIGKSWSHITKEI